METQPASQPGENSGAQDRLQEVYALIWKSHASDDQFDQGEFDNRVPRLMEWLRGLHRSGHLLACGGGGFEHHSGGLTLVKASGPEEAMEIAAGSPMNEIGSTELLVWDLFYADLNEKAQESRLSA